MKTNRAVPFRYDSITTKEGAPVYLFASEPNIEPAKDIMAITSQGIQTEELPIGRFGLNRREQTRLRRLPLEENTNFTEQPIPGEKKF